MLRRLKLLLCLLSLFVLSGSVLAHTISPAVVTVVFSGDGTYSVDIRTNVEAMLARIAPQHADTDDSPNARDYDTLRELPPAELRSRFEEFVPELLAELDARFDEARVVLEYVRIDVPEVGDVEVARNSTIYLTGLIPAGAQRFVWRYPETFGTHVLRLRYADAGEMLAVWLQTGEISEPFELTNVVVPRSRWDVMRDYTVLGFEHIMPLGLDHILFVLGIFLLSFHLKPILWQVTAFTVAHTITLGMTIYGLISLSSSIVEPLIAASIVYVGVENIVVGRLRPWRVAIVFCFGLLHGMGFAGVLAEIGLPRSEFLTALVTFNIGVELGQLSVIAIALVTVGWFRNRPWYRQRIVIPLSALISVIGAYWTVTRLL